MRVYLLKNDKLKITNIPEEISGNFWINDYDTDGKEIKLISVNKDKNNLSLVSNEDVYCIENNVEVASSQLRYYSFNLVVDRATNQKKLLYCTPSLGSNFKMYYLPLNDGNVITIGNSSSNICFKYLEQNHAKIIYEKGKFVIYPISNNGGVYVNNIRTFDQRVLESGDSVFINGLKFIFSKSKEGFQIIFYDFYNMLEVNGLTIANNNFTNEPYSEDSDDLDMKWYKEGDYFHKTPRFISEIIQKEIKIDAPPAKEKEPDMPVILTIGPMLTMSMSSIVMALVSVNNVRNNGGSFVSVLPTITMAVAMLASTLLWPTFTRKFQDKKRIKNEKERIDKYSYYIDKKRKLIVDELKTQTELLKVMYPNLYECQNIILNRKSQLWQKKIKDDDYLKVSLGYGNYPMDLKISYPEEHFSMVEDNLLEISDKLGREPKILKDVPISYSFIENNITGIVGNYVNRLEYLKKLLLQIITFHSYIDLKIIIFTDEDKKNNWSRIATLPHCFSDDKSIRFFSTNVDDHKYICSYLEKIYNSRGELSKKDPHSLDKLYLVITDSYKTIRNIEFINKILESPDNYGFSFIISNGKISSLPEQCKSFIGVDTIDGVLSKNIINSEKQKFLMDISNGINYNDCYKVLANTPIETKENRTVDIPEKLGFLQLFDVGKVEQLNALSRWKLSNPMSTLKTAVGYGKNEEIQYIDIHEKAHGPHGLIAGMTGSGKSEFIITYILSLAANYHPHEVQFILIDYKGGGLAGAFENATSGKKLPHLVGVITNLDKSEIKRTLSSIESELKRRQKLFNLAREKSGEGTIDIYKYQRLYREGKVEEPLSHLLIISDEFAELKIQQPEFMNQLISTARIGRSLGVHLILATQKPSGVVDPQIWSNTRFRVCLRVQDKSDSNEVIKCPDAALLKQTGRFYFQVGYNEVFSLAQAAWAGAKYIPKEKIKKSLDTNIVFINNVGEVVRSVPTKEKVNIENQQNYGEELLNIINYLHDVAETQNIKTKSLWLDKIPAFILIDNLVKKYNFTTNSKILNIPVGEYDIPTEQRQNLLTINFSANGNMVLYGATGSGKENFIMTLMYSAMNLYGPEDINFYVMDFGAEVLNVFDNSPYVGGVINSEDNEKINNLYKLIYNIIETRKDLFSSYGGTYDSYISKGNGKLPRIIVILNNYEAYHDSYENFDELLNIITRDGSKYGIYFLITCNTPNGMRFKLKQNFSQIYSLQQNSDDDYISILGNVNRNYPSRFFGRGIFKSDKVYEFQTAYVSKKEEISDYLYSYIMSSKKIHKHSAKRIPTLPKVVKYDDIKDGYNASLDMVIGIDKKDLGVCNFDFKKKMINIITGTESSVFTNFLNSFIKQLQSVNNITPFILAAEDFNISSSSINNAVYETQDMNGIFEKILKFETDCYELYKNNGYNIQVLKNQKPLVVVINGLERFKSKLNPQNKEKIGDFINILKDLGLINFIIVDTISNIKKSEYENWFRKAVDFNEVIWIGNGFNEQYTFKTPVKIPELRENIGEDFCFVIQKGKIKLVKYIYEFDKELDMIEE